MYEGVKLFVDLLVDYSRVILSGGDPEKVGSDYINANFISGEVPGSENQYIATQGCLPATIKDFWRMVWQQKSTIIVMTCNEVESGKVDLNFAAVSFSAYLLPSFVP